MPRVLLPLIATLLVITFACNPESSLWEECDRPAGTAGVCEPGTVCGRPSSNSSVLVCVPACSKDDHCPKDADCKEVVDGSGIKGCRYKD
jgi:hypothetical protein